MKQPPSQFTDQDLSGTTLSGLRGARLVRCDLSRTTAATATRLDAVTAVQCRFDDARLETVQLPGADLEGCGFAGAGLGRCNFEGARVLGCSFAGADLASSDWSGARVGGASFAGARLEGADLSGAVFEACDFRGADLAASAADRFAAGARFRRCDFRGAGFDGRSLAGAIFEGCAFHGVRGRPELGDARILRADLSPWFDGSTVLLDPVAEWSALQSSDVAVAGALVDGAARASAPVPWVDLPGGPCDLGLDDDDARRFAAWAAARARQAVEDDPDPLHGAREREALEETWGNPDHLLELLAFSRPRHRVELVAYRIAATPVTVADYAEFVRETGARPPERGPGATPPPLDAPVTGVSWEEAAAYAAWRGAALPGESQWERAARGGDGRLFPWGDEWGTAGAALDASDEPAPVGSRPELASPEGVHDLVTHHYEWTADEFGPYPGADRRACDRLPPPPGGWWGTRARRGGSVRGLPPSAVTRDGVDPALRLRDTTFRLVNPR